MPALFVTPPLLKRPLIDAVPLLVSDPVNVTDPLLVSVPLLTSADPVIAPLFVANALVPMLSDPAPTEKVAPGPIESVPFPIATPGVLHCEPASVIATLAP